jgi:hypothetical protein
VILGLVFEEKKIKIFAGHEENGIVFVVIFAKETEGFFALAHAGASASQKRGGQPSFVVELFLRQIEFMEKPDLAIAVKARALNKNRRSKRQQSRKMR